jgi:alpha-mannosidase
VYLQIWAWNWEKNGPSITRLFPTRGGWQEAGVYRAGLEFNNPLIVRAGAKHDGTLRKRWGLFEISQLNVVTSAVKLGETSGFILRVYEASGRPAAKVRIKFPNGALVASEANLIEEGIQEVNLQDNNLFFDLRPYEIKTFKLELSKTK